MKTLFMTKGLPASGKTTWALSKIATQPGAYKRINKDDLRDMIDGGKWSRSNEEFVLKMRDQIVAAALWAGKHVIVDDTNLAPKHEERLREIAKECNAAFTVVPFIHDVTLEECIARDKKRPNYVGEKVIRDMYNQFLAPKPEPIAYNENLPWCIIVDIDGTVAKMNGRSPYDYTRVSEDLPNWPVCGIVSNPPGRELIVFVSGRKAMCQEDTEKWLEATFNFHSPLFMRAADDDRDDTIVKREIYEREIKGKYNVRFVLDDRNKVVRMWRELGLTCLQVADGDF